MRTYIAQKLSRFLSAYRSSDIGFTLVEGVVGAVISSLVTGIMLTILNMNNDGVKNGAVNAKIQSQYEIAIAEIGNYTRSSHVVLNDASSEIFPPGLNLTNITTSKIMMFTENPLTGAGTAVRGFWVNNGQLKEWKPGTGWTNFVVGAWPTLSVLDATPFTLSANRKIVTITMRVTGTFGGVTAIAPARGEVFACRN